MTPRGLPAAGRALGVVQAIAARSRADAADRRRRVSDSALERLVLDAPPARDFAAALRAPGLGLIAEFKPKSPSRGAIRPNAEPEDLAEHYRPYAAAISVLTDGPYFGGSHELLSRMRAAVPVPVLNKDFVQSEYQVLEARAAGADAVLLMASLLDDATLRRLLATARGIGLEALVEVHDRAELDRVLATDATVIGVNARDLRTLQIDAESAAALLRDVPEDRVAVAESGVTTRGDADALRASRADAVLIGSALMATPEPCRTIEALGFPRCR
jgi:indole-3-glycerol phosphate synthase/phosphoribosylanthranilate isomerase